MGNCRALYLVYANCAIWYLSYTKEFHQMALSPSMGKHLLSLVDESGERLELNFEVMSSEKH